ncbi:MAG TPA: hypothetical protein D7H89_04555 [Candidatus Poseidoniales archaeon]|nr:MAG TPA: hypothetical protein D7H89_04555 [Candidatus Poseidoniales archaeon]
MTMLASSVLLSALFAGLVATGVTLAIERWGGLVGGVLGTVPSTIVPAAAGMHLSGSQDELLQSMAIVPLGMLLNALFLGVWVVLPNRLSTRRPLLVTTLVSLIVWACAGVALLAVIGKATSQGTSHWTIGFIGLFLLIALAVRFNFQARPTPKGSRQVQWPVLVGRGGAAAFAIGCAVWLSSQGLPLLAGLAAVFPAIFLTSMVALWLAQGETVPQGAAGPMMLGGVSVAVYALVVMWSIPALGPVSGSVLAWFVAVGGWSYPVYLILRRRDLSHSLRESSALQPEPLQS